ncbi:hypothetical protein CVT24_005200 [Panaeolus cyanescens]|uniref:Uncharacterized protein n=1 Tax=Panaeolus cyanescens TaxID=181874 RepID=A0A409Y933_9AGAR|nr:hypothetical protein CVT24_005200 [Panaeolus cyanescens]
MSRITVNNVNYTEINGTYISTVNQNIVRRINVGNMEEVHVTEDIIQTEQLIIDEDQNDEQSVSNTNLELAIAGGPSETTAFDLLGTVDPNTLADLIEAGKLQVSNGKKSKSSRRGSSGPSSSSSSAPRQESRPEDVPHIKYLQNFGDIEHQHKEFVTDDHNSMFFDNAKNAIKAASEAGEGQHLRAYSAETTRHTMRVNGNYINPNIRSKKINGTYEETRDEHHEINERSYNVKNVSFNQHTRIETVYTQHTERD